ncbi:glycosyltransferase family 4 protein [Cohnella panacarvi]|uniref:glycosyltransferase family 4 protein n=1 Tax=Cohnella panacarvi TaxID=400776 RepID=UPI00047C0333|nr:glycosyltransferase family 4 protein [Cohnella panacarvi]
MSGTTKPKLLIFSHICNPVLVTGGEKVLSLFLRELVRHYECVLVVPEIGVIAHKARAIGIRLIVMDIPLCFSLYTCSPSAFHDIDNLMRQPAWRKLDALLAYERPDAVMVNTSVHPLPAMAAFSKGIPTAWLLMETLYDTPLRDQCAAFIASHCDVIVGMSRTVLKPFRKTSNVRAAYVLPPYLERSELFPSVWPQARSQLRRLYQWDEDHCVVGFIAATIYPNKGQMQFIDAMLPVASEHKLARFLIVGSQVDEGHYMACRTKVLQAGLEDRFVFYPFAEQVHLVYPAMDIVVVPSLMTEGFGMTALEGMAFGKAVVAYSSGGLAEILNATRNERFLVPKGDVSGLTDRVGSLAGDNALRHSVSDRNGKTSMREFGVESFRDRLHALMGMIAAIPKNRPPVPIPPLIDIPVAQKKTKPRSASTRKRRGRKPVAGRKSARSRRRRSLHRYSRRSAANRGRTARLRNRPSRRIRRRRSARGRVRK